jgi:tRNA(Ile)-lysidine synthase
MKFSAASLRAVLEAHTPAAATGLALAVSGGFDSACLLVAMAELRTTPFRDLPMRALHVDHGLQAAAGKFREACIAQCGRLQIPLTVIAVSVDVANGTSIEAAARAARYQGIARQLGVGECVLTAHHALDQAETLLLQLLRGSGLKGLSAMPVCRPLGSGWHLRPLLDVAHGELLEFGAGAGIRADGGARADGGTGAGDGARAGVGITTVQDPMNRDTRFDRAYLRARVWPLIERRWAGAENALSRAARHVANAQELLDDSAALSLQRLRDGDALAVTGLRALSEPEQQHVLRHWIQGHGVTLPSTARLAEALRQVVEADADHLPAVTWGAHALRRYRGRLFLTAAEPPTLGQVREWLVAPAARLELGRGLGELHWTPQAGGLDAGRLPRTLQVRQRQGGETLKPHPRARTQTVQHLCQSLGVLPWMRDALPLLYADDALIAVGDLWMDTRWRVAAGAAGFGCDWRDAPIIV